MTFSKLAEYFERLEQTSSRLTLIDILAELFSGVKQSDIAKVSYLIQGRVAPFYEPIEIGMSEKLVAESIARAYGIKREEVCSSFSKYSASLENNILPLLSLRGTNEVGDVAIFPPRKILR